MILHKIQLIAYKIENTYSIDRERREGIYVVVSHLEEIRRDKSSMRSWRSGDHDVKVKQKTAVFGRNYWHYEHEDDGAEQQWKTYECKGKYK